MSDCLRNLDRSLGATHNQHVATADACCDALLLAADRPSPRELWKWAVSKTRLRAYELRKLFGGRGRGERGSDFFLESTSHCAGISKLTFL